MYELVLERARELEEHDVAVIATDPAGVVIYWSSGATALYGWTAEEAVGQNVLDLTPGELSRPEAEKIMRALRGGQRWSGEFLVHDRSGALFTVRVTDVPVSLPTGELIGIVGLSQRVSYITIR